MANLVEFVYKDVNYCYNIENTHFLLNKKTKTVNITAPGGGGTYTFETQSEAQELYDKLRGTTRECSDTCLRNSAVLYHIDYCLNKLKENGKIDDHDLDRMNRMEQDGYPNPFNPSYKPPIAENATTKELQTGKSGWRDQIEEELKDPYATAPGFCSCNVARAAGWAYRNAGEFICGECGKIIDTRYEPSTPKTENATTDEPTYHGPYHSKCIWCGVPRQTGLDCPNSCEFKRRNPSKEPTTSKTESNSNLIRINGDAYIKLNSLTPSPRDNEFCMSQDRFNEYQSYKQKLDQIRENLNQFCFSHTPAIKDVVGIFDSLYITKIKAILEDKE